MPFDDEDTPGAQIPASLAAQASEDAPTAEETMEEEAQDFRLFASLINKKNISSKSIRKGEKDFEEHGTKAQANALEQSRQVMEEVMSYTRVHKQANWLRGWYFPDRWADAVEPDEAEASQNQARREAQDATTKRRGLRDRVVVVEHERGHFKTMGRIVTGQGKDQPGWDKIWLLPEEALFLLERGSLDLWWPTRSLGDIFPVKSGSEESEVADQPNNEEEDEYDLGMPLSLEAAYSLLIGNDKERGKTTLQSFQTYSNLSRAGYRILRAPSSLPPSPPISQPLWQWLVSLLFPEKEPCYAAVGPLVRPGLYRSYKSIYKQLAIIPRHKPSQELSSWEVQEPFRIHYHVWKAGTSPWSKTRPPPPDFYLAIVDTRETSVPSLEEISALLDSSPWDPPKAQWNKPGQIYPRLKWGWRNILVAIVDHGIVNFLRFGEGAFGEEPLYPRFDTIGGPRGGKRGGRNQRSGRGGGRGRGGRGRGR